MAIALGNATQHGYNTYESPPGWIQNVWMGSAIIDGTPANSWDVLDHLGFPLVVPANSRIADVGLGFFGDLIGTNGDRIKWGATATDTNPYVVNSNAFSSGLLAAHDTQLLLAPYTTVTVNTQFTGKLWLHTSNAASSNTARAAATTPATQVIPAEFPTFPVLVQVRVVYLTPTGGPRRQDPLYLCEEHQRKILGLPDLA
jgi:hypothetical protein